MKKVISAKADLKGILLLAVFWLIASFLFSIYSYTGALFYSVVYVFIFILMSEENKYYLILFALPFAAIFKVHASLPSMIIILYLIYILDFIRKKNLKANTLDIICLLWIAFFQVVAILFYKASIISIFSFLLNIIFTKVCIVNFLRVHKENKKIFFKNSVRYFSSALMMSIISADAYSNITQIIKPMITYEGQINRFAGLNGDANYYSQLILVAVSLLIAVILYSDNIKQNIVEILICIFLITSGFRSLSKNYVLTITALFILFIIYFYRKMKKNNKNMVFVLLSYMLGIIIGGIIVYLLWTNMIIPLFELRSGDELFTGRTEIWLQYLELIYNKFYIIITGVGFSNGANVLSRYSGTIAYAAHNAYIEMLVDIGILGILLVIIFLRQVFVNFYKDFKNAYSMYISMFLITSVALSISSSDAIFILLPLIVLVKYEERVYSINKGGVF